MADVHNQWGMFYMSDHVNMKKYTNTEWWKSLCHSTNATTQGKSRGVMCCKYMANHWPNIVFNELWIQIDVWALYWIPSVNWQLNKDNMGISSKIILQHIPLTSPWPYVWCVWEQNNQQRTLDLWYPLIELSIIIASGITRRENCTRTLHHQSSIEQNNLQWCQFLRMNLESALILEECPLLGYNVM
jgi:hypothetical protein